MVHSDSKGGAGTLRTSCEEAVRICCYRHLLGVEFRPVGMVVMVAADSIPHMAVAADMRGAASHVEEASEGTVQASSLEEPMLLAAAVELAWTPFAASFELAQQRLESVSKVERVRYNLRVDEF